MNVQNTLECLVRCSEVRVCAADIGQNRIEH